MIAIAAMAPTTVSAPASAEAGVRAFLASAYAGYARQNGPGAPLGRPTALFEPGLAVAIARDRAKGVGALDFDPFCAGQDWTPFVAMIGPISVSGTRATAAVHFTNGRPVTLRFTLVRTPMGWRIYEMNGTDLPSLRTLVLRPHPRRTGDDAVD